jgi:hypothetical protein
MYDHSIVGVEQIDLLGTTREKRFVEEGEEYTNPMEEEIKACRAMVHVHQHGYVDISAH